MPGFKLLPEDKKKIPDKFLCSSCNEVLREPVQTIECGHLYCTSCFHEIMGMPNPECKVDNVKLTEGKNFPDRCMNREIMGLVVRCVFAVYGCVWSGELRNLEGHGKECKHAPIKCFNEGCDAELRREDLAEHLQKDCVARIIACQYCHAETKFNLLQEHLDKTCSKCPVCCPDCGLQGIERQKFRHHHEVDCKEAKVECAYQEVGCPLNKKMKRKEKDEHEKEKTEEHLKQILNFILTLRQEVLELINDVSCLKTGKKENQELAGKLSEQDKKFTKGIAEIKQGINANLKKMKTFEEALKKPKDKQETNGLKPDHMLSEFFSELRRNGVRRGESEAWRELQYFLGKQVHDDINYELKKYEDLVYGMQRRLETQEHLLSKKDAKISALEDKILELRTTSYNGVLLWKIEDVTRRIAEAKSGKQTSFYSPPFFSDFHGYKMCARIYLNGDGMGKGTHVSVFFVVMRSDHDAILSWPFRHKVVILIMEQGGTNHAVDAFVPDAKSSSFKRPNTHMNIATGCPLFLSLGDLKRRNFIQDDCMFVKIVVDTRV